MEKDMVAKFIQEMVQAVEKKKAAQEVILREMVGNISRAFEAATSGAKTQK